MPWCGRPAAAIRGDDVLCLYHAGVYDAVVAERWIYVAFVEDVHELLELDTLVTGTDARAEQVRSYLRQRKRECEDVAPLPFDQRVTVEGFPRRSRVDHRTPAERAIQDAVDAVESVGAHPWLTRAVILLNEARERVADFVDRAIAEGLLRAAVTAGPLVNGEPYCTDCGGRPGDHSPECSMGDLAIKVPIGQELCVCGHARVEHHPCGSCEHECPCLNYSGVNTLRRLPHDPRRGK